MMDRKIKPLGKRILAEKIEPEKRTTAGGIVLPDNVQSEKVVQAKVLAVGTDEKFEVRVGDQIIVGTFAGTEIQQGEMKMILVKESDVLAIVEK